MMVRPITNSHFWQQWVFVNALGELVALGMGSVVTALLSVIFLYIGHFAPNLIWMTILLLSAAIRGGVLGFAQVWILRKRLPQLHQRKWLVATVLGAMLSLLARTPVGSLFHNLMASTNHALGSSGSTFLLLAMVSGLGLGAIAALPQWPILRQHVRPAVWWIPGNAVAWGCGNAIMVWFAGSFAGEPRMLNIIVNLTATGLGGAIAAALHGGVLLWLFSQRRP